MLHETSECAGQSFWPWWGRLAGVKSDLGARSPTPVSRWDFKPAGQSGAGAVAGPCLVAVEHAGQISLPRGPFGAGAVLDDGTMERGEWA